ncbi:MAG: pentapeptide repeat-containing protein [Mastigocoleus sp.]
MNLEELLKKYALGVRDFSKIDLSEANLSGVKLTRVNLSHANLSVVNLSGANLSSANLHGAKLNVARLRGSTLTGADLSYASLNVANLIRADLSHTQMRKTSLIRAELIRANLSRADLWEANLNSADLREATLRQANLRNANLNQATLRDASLTGANFEQANLSNSDLARTDVSGGNFRDAELSQANISGANLSGANLSGANLRWADLSGANLRWADLSGAKLSGANLIGADLSNTNLTNTSLVHADLTQAKLIKAEWVGADLTGAILTGAQLYATSRFGLKTEGIICEWVDLSPTGDRSIVQKFNSEESREFFNETPPTITIVIDTPLDYEANFVLAGAYYQIAHRYKYLKQPPTMEIGRRRTVFTFRVESDESLLPTAYMAILPFKDAEAAHKNICTALDIITHKYISKFSLEDSKLINKLNKIIEEVIINVKSFQETKNHLKLAKKLDFFQSPTQMILTNSNAKTLIIHENNNFGKRFTARTDANISSYNDSKNDREIDSLPDVNKIISFIQSFHNIVI